MSAMSREEAREFLEKVFANMFDPQAAAESLSEFFSTDYVQDADGARLDFNGFIDHARVLKNTFTSGHVRLEEILVDGPKIADVHIIEATKANGDTIRVKVIALYYIGERDVARYITISILKYSAPLTKGQPELYVSAEET